jgi:F-type H+-transporting ATPase subunit b
MLDFDYTILVQFFNFLVLLVLLNFLLFKPILRAVQKRQSTIQSLAEKADGSREQVAGLGRAYEENLKEKKQPIIEEREAALRDAHASSMKVIEEARHELTRELAKIKDTVKSEAETTLQALKAEADRLAQDVTQKILKRGM